MDLFLACSPSDDDDKDCARSSSSLPGFSHYPRRRRRRKLRRKLSSSSFSIDRDRESQVHRPGTIWPGWKQQDTMVYREIQMGPRTTTATKKMIIQGKQHDKTNLFIIILLDRGRERARGNFGLASHPSLGTFFGSARFSSPVIYSLHGLDGCLSLSESSSSSSSSRLTVPSPMEMVMSEDINQPLAFGKPWSFMGICWCCCCCLFGNLLTRLLLSNQMSLVRVWMVVVMNVLL